MKLTLKKEVVNSVVYESNEKDAPVRSVYVMKSWFAAQNLTGNTYPNEITLEVTCG